MKTLSVLQYIAGLARRNSGDAADSLTDAVRALREALPARGAYLIYGEDWFRQLGRPGEPDDYEIKQEGYWLLNRFMVEGATSCAFNVSDKRVSDMVAAQPGLKRSHMAALVPMPEGNAEMLIVDGLRERLRSSHLALLEAAAPIMAPLVARLVDPQRSRRQKQQLRALADIARVVVRVREKEQVLAEVATAVSGASGFGIVAISVLDSSGSRLEHRALNLQRYSDHPVSQAYKNGALDHVIIPLAKSKKPMIYPDLANEKRVPEQVRFLLSGKGLLASMATFPLVFQDEVLGLMSLSDLSPRRFDPPEVELLEGLTAQVSMTLKGLDMYEELHSSREKLQDYADRLKESMSIEYRLARTDSLTGIPNRRYLEEAIAGESGSGAGGESGLAVVMADIDDFKEINDRFGHLFGDDILRLVASLGWQTCRRGEIVGRYGGDEFLFILPGRTIDEALTFAEEFRQAVQKSTLYAPPGDAVGVRVSIGVSECGPDQADKMSDLVGTADRAMYEAKSRGGNQVRTTRTEPAPKVAG